MPYTFTMNWKFTRPNHRVHFGVDEPFCHIFPLQRGSLEDVTPVIRKLSDAPDLEREFKIWSQRRNAFNADLADPASQAAQEKWQKGYFKGKQPSGGAGSQTHYSRLRLRSFK
ncbi:DUF6065 family protein [Ochrobactrum teleogrylli]|uniref:DUF6065 family protein n=1 Tax=Ochrobactrum teleogrylli TaxID=2479765 RepID=A0ABD5K0C3_9HYPH